MRGLKSGFISELKSPQDKNCVGSTNSNFMTVSTITPYRLHLHRYLFLKETLRLQQKRHSVESRKKVSLGCHVNIPTYFIPRNNVL